MAVFHAVINVLITRQIPKIGQERVAAIKHAQLHLFERHHIGHQLRAGFFPLRSPGHEIIFDYPLTERLTGHPCRVAYAGNLFNFRQSIGRDGRHNAIHHGGREGHVRVDPVSQFAVHRAGIGTGDIAHHMAVLWHVIAGHYRKGRQTRRFASRQRFYDHADGGNRGMRLLQIGSD